MRPIPPAVLKAFGLSAQPAYSKATREATLREEQAVREARLLALTEAEAKLVCPPDSWDTLRECVYSTVDRHKQHGYECTFANAVGLFERVWISLVFGLTPHEIMDGLVESKPRESDG